MQCISRSKERTQPKSRSRSRSQSTSPSMRVKRHSMPDSQAFPSSYKKALLSKSATTTAATGHQQPQASETSKAKAAPREIDFTGCSAIAFVLIILLVIFGIVVAIFPSRTLQMVYSCCGAAIFCFYIVMDTQLIVGGAQRKCSLSPEDYIAGALMLYLDAINLFLYILQILNQLNGDQS
ncbi:hypothetical protein MRX96_041363 [Rhipicephalus microplus]